MVQRGRASARPTLAGVLPSLRGLNAPLAALGQPRAFQCRCGGPKVPFFPPVAARCGGFHRSERLVGGEPGTGSFSVSEAIQMFAMFPPGLKLASTNLNGGILSDGQVKAPDLAVYGKQPVLYHIRARTVRRIGRVASPSTIAL